MMYRHGTGEYYTGPQGTGEYFTNMNGLGAASSDEQGQQGMVALGIAGGIFAGWCLAWLYWSNKPAGKRK